MISTHWTWTKIFYKTKLITCGSENYGRRAKTHTAINPREASSSERWQPPSKQNSVMRARERVREESIFWQENNNDGDDKATRLSVVSAIVPSRQPTARLTHEHFYLSARSHYTKTKDRTTEEILTHFRPTNQTVSSSSSSPFYFLRCTYSSDFFFCCCWFYFAWLRCVNCVFFILLMLRLDAGVIETRANWLADENS